MLCITNANRLPLLDYSPSSNRLTLFERTEAMYVENLEWCVELLASRFSSRSSR